MFEEMNEQNEAKKIALVVLISLKREAEKRSSEELKTAILEAIKEGLVRVPWLVLEDVVLVQE